jgi:Tfp pilus assembly protein PilF
MAMGSGQMRGWMLAVAVAAAVAGPLVGAMRGDIIELKDGRKFNGSMRRDGEMIVITGEDGKTATVGASAVAKVTLQSNTPPAQLAASEWTRVSALVSKAATLDAVIDLHKKFLEKYPNEPASADARKSLEQYQAMVGKDVLKYRGRWLTRDMIRDQERAWETEAAAATERYKAGKLAEAREAAIDSLGTDPENPLTLAIAGLASYRLNELPKARTFFTKLASVDPGSVLAENNLGVIAFQQKQQPEGLVHYTKAIQAKPDNRLVLDNAADAMGTYLGSKDIDAYRNLARQYAQAEAAMETDMAKRGLYRFGSTWLPKEQKEKYGADRQQVLTAMAQLDAKYAIARQAVDQLDLQLKQASADYEQTATDLANLQLSSIGTRGGYIPNYDGNRTILANNLDVLARRKADLQTRKEQATQSLQPFFAEAARLKAALAALPEVSYTGVQRIMEPQDVDDPPPPAPLKINMQAATAPAPRTPPPASPAPPAAPQMPYPGTGYDPGTNFGGNGGYGGGFGGGGGVPVVPTPDPNPNPDPAPAPAPNPGSDPVPAPNPRLGTPPNRDRAPVSRPWVPARGMEDDADAHSN